jgi:hypothetical protein
LKLTFFLKSEDFLAFQLFTASQSESIQRKRRRGQIFLSIGSLAFALFFYIGNSAFLSIYFLVFAVVTYIFYPRYFKKRYHKHYRNFIRDNYENRLNVEQEVDIDKDKIILKDKTGEASIKLEEVEEVTETPKHFFVKISTGVSLIFPKNSISVETVREKLQSLGLTIVDYSDWAW